MDKTKSGNKLIITCDSSDGINKSATKSVTFSNLSDDQKYTLEHDRSGLWRNIVQNTNSTKGFGDLATIVPDGTDLLEFFRLAPNGVYRLDGTLNTYNDTLGIPFPGYWYDVFVTCHGLSSITDYKTLTFIGGIDGSITIGSFNDGQWKGFNSTGVPPGTPIPYPSATPPLGYLLLNGGSFDVTKYKMLGKLFTNGILPDLRGEFIRGWDNGKNVDSGRTLLSSQSSNIATHRHWSYFYAGTTRPNEAMLKDLPSGTSFLSMSLDTTVLSPDSLDAKPGSMLPVDDYATAPEAAKNPNRSAVGLPTSNVGTGSETYPRNVAFNYIIRAL